MLTLLLTIFRHLTNLFLTAAVFSTGLNLWTEMKIGEKLALNTLLAKTSFLAGTCCCGWLCLLKYKEYVQDYFSVLVIVTSVLSIIVAVYIILAIIRYLKQQKKKETT